MGGLGEREGEGLSFSGNGPAAVLQQQPPVVTNYGGGGSVEKVKFTVSVRGHQWSSARHVNETLQEFVTAMQRNARRLNFIKEDDSIESLQMVHGDGSEPEDLDVDATLGDVIICMGNKHLEAIVSSTKSTPSNSIPSANVDTVNLGAASMGGCRQGSHTHGHGHGSLLGTLSPANKLANMLMQGSSSHPHHSMQQPGESFGCHVNVAGAGLAMAGQCGNQSNVASPALSGGCQSFVSALLSSLPMLPNQDFTVHCPHGKSANIALLTRFLVSQLRAFVPVKNSQGAAHPFATTATLANAMHACAENAMHGAMHPSPCRENKAAATVCDYNAMNVSSGSADHNPPPNAPVATPEKENTYPEDVQNGSSPKNIGNHVKPPVKYLERKPVKFFGRHKTPGGETWSKLTMSDLSPYFHLSLTNAAKKLGLCTTSLKKACRCVGLKRWPGRKVRSLKRAIQGVEHTLAVGQGAGLENEVQKLQQEMDRLVHGTPAQHSRAVSTFDVYKRLYSQGWRSRQHSSGRQDVDLDADDHENQPSGLGPQLAEKGTETTRVANSAVNEIPGDHGQTNQQQKPKPKYEPQGREAMMKEVDIEGLLKEPSPKRPKWECRPATEAAVGQGLPSSTCAILPTGTIKYVLPKLELDEEPDS